MFKKKDAGALSHNDRIYLQNAAKTLAANIRFSSAINPLGVVGITSSVPNEGKTTVAYMLGEAMASSGTNVLLMDCDFRNRSLAKKAQVHPRRGIYGVLAGQCKLSDAVVSLRTPRLYLLDVEPGIPNPVDVLSSKRFASLMQHLRKQFGFIIVDTPPLSAFVDAAVVSQNTDGMLLVVRDEYTKRQELLDAYSQLKKADANVIGTVLNFCSADHSGNYYSYYSKGEKKRSSLFGSDVDPDWDAPRIPSMDGAAAVGFDGADTIGATGAAGVAPASPFTGEATSAASHSESQGR